MSGLIAHVAIVSQTKQVTHSETTKIAAAIQKQVLRDFGPLWQIQSTVGAFQTVEDVPVGYWPILIREDIGEPGAAGFHTDKNGEPYALVAASDELSLTVSHELLEMLGDPYGNRFVAADSIKKDQGVVKYLVEVADPCESERFGYEIDGIKVSDFYTPDYFNATTTTGVRYSFTGAISRPKQVLFEGYLSWMDPTSGRWWQATYFGRSMKIEGPFNWQRVGGQSWREVVEAQTRELVA